MRVGKMKGKQQLEHVERSLEEVIWLTVCVRVHHLFVGHYSGCGIVDLAADRLWLVLGQTHKNTHKLKNICAYW